jgi:hypothetical protein
VNLKQGGATAARIVDVARDHASLLGGLGDRRPRARSRPWIPPPGSALCSTSRKAAVGRLGGLARAHVGGNANGRKLGLAGLHRPIWPFLFPPSSSKLFYFFLHHTN